jgi:hypothetical protein
MSSTAGDAPGRQAGQPTQQEAVAKAPPWQRLQGRGDRQSRPRGARAVAKSIVLCRLLRCDTRNPWRLGGHAPILACNGNSRAFIEVMCHLERLTGSKLDVHPANEGAVVGQPR